MSGRDAFYTPLAGESLVEVALRHIQGDRISPASRDTFAQWDVCHVHDGVLVNKESDPTLRNPQCLNCSNDNPRLKLLAPILRSSDLVPLRRAWQEAWARMEAAKIEINKGNIKNEADASERQGKVRQLRNDPLEMRTWTQYWLGAWQARNKVVAMHQSRKPFLDGTKACQAFIREFVDDWQLRHPDVARGGNDADESQGPRPHIECPIHHTAGAMFPFAEPENYNPACWICLVPRVRTSSTMLPDEVSDSEFSSLCGLNDNGTRVVSRAPFITPPQAAAAASSGGSSSSMYDVEEEEEKEKS